MKIKQWMWALLVCGLFCGTVQADLVNINTADVSQLQEGLLGVGPEKAAAIVEWRIDHGPFNSLQDLARVKGIGVRILEQNRARIMLREGSSRPSAD